MASDYALKLGKLLGNLHSLEAMLRFYLLKQGAQKRQDTTVGPSYWGLAVGDVIEVDEFSNYDSLSDLVRKFNDDVVTLEPALCVDKRVIHVRDTMAHGRVVGTAQDTATLQVVRFSRPSAGKVTVVEKASLDDAWFETQVPFVADQVMKVGKALERRGD